jgi:hypothetical protein
VNLLAIRLWNKPSKCKTIDKRSAGKGNTNILTELLRFEYMTTKVQASGFSMWCCELPRHRPGGITGQG